MFGKRQHRDVPRHPLTLMTRVYRYVLPEVKSELAKWRRAAEQMPDPELRRQALASMTTKQFHCQGGAVYAAANLSCRRTLIPLIVAFQTISDYLDNLCDRSTSLDPADFRSLHQAMLDAADPERPLGDYYAYRSEKDDGDYLRRLVLTCRERIGELPAYELVKRDVLELVGLYCDLQVHKHIRPDKREEVLLAWWRQHRGNWPELEWNEFAAATGSTLGVFMLFLAAADPGLRAADVRAIREAYFPYVCGLHILLDYLIDQEEDSAGGDLNFCSYYRDDEHAGMRISRIAETARRKVESLAAPAFHRMIIEGLLALYLSDPKARRQQSVRRVSRALMKNSPLTRLFFWANSAFIRFATWPRSRAT